MAHNTFYTEFWEKGIQTELETALKQAWEEAIRVEVLHMDSLTNTIKVKISGRIIPYWIAKGNYVSITRKKAQERFLINAEVLAVTRRTKEVILKAKQKLFKATTVIHMWLLNFSAIPYHVMKQDVQAVVEDYEYPTAQSLLTSNCVESATIEVIQGAPGTGKTTQIVERCKQLHERFPNTKILLTAFTHKACANMAEKLHEHNIPFISIDVKALTPELHTKYDLKNLAERMLKHTEILDMFGTSLNVLNQVKAYHNYIKQLQEILLGRDAIFICTAMSARRKFRLQNQTSTQQNKGSRYIFDYTFVDEGSQLSLPTLARIKTLTERMIVYGDPIQLPPVVQAPLIQQYGEYYTNPLRLTIFNKLPPRKIQFLPAQFRGRPEIFMLVSALFYGGRLQTGQFIPQLPNYPSIDFVDSSGSQDIERVNTGEVQLCQEMINRLEEDFPTRRLSIGILSPFRRQIGYLRHSLRIPTHFDVDIGTVHICQGRTYDVVIYSLASTTPSQFLNPPQEWLLNLKNNLFSSFDQLIQKIPSLVAMGYPDYTVLLERVYASWYDYLTEYCRRFYTQPQNEQLSSMKLRDDAERDTLFEFEDFYTLLPCNEHAPNIFNVALSRARHSLTIIGNYEALVFNPIVELIVRWNNTIHRIQEGYT